jgi:hypothetical protein
MVAWALPRDPYHSLHSDAVLHRCTVTGFPSLRNDSFDAMVGLPSLFHS